MQLMYTSRVNAIRKWLPRWIFYEVNVYISLKQVHFAYEVRCVQKVGVAPLRNRYLNSPERYAGALLTDDIYSNIA